MNVKPRSKDDEDVEATPLSRSYSDQIRSTMEKLANRPGKFVEREPFDVTRMGKAEGIRAAKPWELFEGERQDAVVTNPRNILAQFAQRAFPRMYRRLDAHPTEKWEFQIMSRQQPLAKQYDPYRHGMSGGTLYEPNPTGVNYLGVRNDRWRNMLAGSKESTLAHELNHAIRRRGAQAAREMIPGKTTPALKLEKMVETARTGRNTGGGLDLGEFRSRYAETGETRRYSNQEALTEAAGRTATNQSVRTGRYGNAVESAKSRQKAEEAAAAKKASGEAEAVAALKRFLGNR